MSCQKISLKFQKQKSSPQNIFFLTIPQINGVFNQNLLCEILKAPGSFVHPEFFIEVIILAFYDHISAILYTCTCRGAQRVDLMKFLKGTETLSSSNKEQRTQSLLFDQSYPSQSTQSPFLSYFSHPERPLYFLFTP